LELKKQKSRDKKKRNKANRKARKEGGALGEDCCEDVDE
jgi:hypothetical protein